MTTSPRLHHVFLALLVASATAWSAGGCAEPEMFDRAEGTSAESGTVVPPVEIDEDGVIAMAMNYKTMLQPLSDTPEESETHSDAAKVLVWGSPASASLFQSIDPTNPLQDISFPEGTLLVKEHFDEAGGYIGLTLMYKGPQGYHAEGRDWFWARVHRDELPHLGHVDFWLSCRIAAHVSDFVVGFGKSH